MDWNEVKSKPKKKNTKPKEEVVKPVYGGKKGGNKLVAGPIKNANLISANQFGYDHSEVTTNAAAIADYEDYYEENAVYEEVKYETVSTTCAHAVSEARMKANLTQGDLAKKVGVKPAVIVDIENGSARYDAPIINAIEKALGSHIPRGRKKK